MQTRQIAGTTVSAIGLGGMPMSLEDRPPHEQGIRTIHAALDAGVTFIDTADAYCQGGDDTGHNERLIAKALSTWSGDADSILVATKGGHYRTTDGEWKQNGDPAYLKQACEASLEALGVEAIGLYQYPSPVVIPIPGASRPETILDSVQAADLELSAEELASLDAA